LVVARNRPRPRTKCQSLIGLPTQAEVDGFLRRADEAGAQLIFEAGDQMWGHAGAFADPDGHQWQVTEARSVLAR